MVVRRVLKRSSVALLASATLIACQANIGNGGGGKVVTDDSRLKVAVADEAVAKSSVKLNNAYVYTVGCDADGFRDGRVYVYDDDSALYGFGVTNYSNLDTNCLSGDIHMVGDDIYMIERTFPSIKLVKYYKTFENRQVVAELTDDASVEDIVGRTATSVVSDGRLYYVISVKPDGPIEDYMIVKRELRSVALDGSDMKTHAVYDLPYAILYDGPELVESDGKVYVCNPYRTKGSNGATVYAYDTDADKFELVAENLVGGVYNRFTAGDGVVYFYESKNGTSVYKIDGGKAFFASKSGYYIKDVKAYDGDVYVLYARNEEYANKASDATVLVRYDKFGVVTGEVNIGYTEEYIDSNMFYKEKNILNGYLPNDISIVGVEDGYVVIASSVAGYADPFEFGRLGAVDFAENVIIPVIE